ncbi:thiamine-phosphate kinase [bacterium]|nr:thiamine-phosphate kinase [bacterium]
MNELDWIRKIQSWVEAPAKGVAVGIGDDAAVLNPSEASLVLTTDSLVDGVHFDLAYSSPEDLGHKALAVNLSDIAAMGARPKYALVNLVLPPGKAENFLPGFYKGLSAEAQSAVTSIIGGNLSRCEKGLVICVTAVGEQVGAPRLRSGARPRDTIFLWGAVGHAAAGLQALQSLGLEEAKALFPTLVQAQLRPKACLSDAWLSLGVHASIDVSDGLVSELWHLARASSVGMELFPQNLDLTALQPLADESGAAALDWALYGGEDYALLFTAAAGKDEEIARALPGVRAIGRVHAGEPSVWISTEKGHQPLEARGFDHFGDTKA